MTLWFCFKKLILAVWDLVQNITEGKEFEKWSKTVHDLMVVKRWLISMHSCIMLYCIMSIYSWTLPIKILTKKQVKSHCTLSILQRERPFFLLHSFILRHFWEGSNSWTGPWIFKLTGYTSWNSSPCWRCPGAVMHESAWWGYWSSWRRSHNSSNLGWKTGDSQMQTLEF